MKKAFLCVVWLAILPWWVGFALLHTAAALLTKNLFYLEELFGNTMDEVEWKVKKISLEKDK